MGFRGAYRFALLAAALLGHSAAFASSGGITGVSQSPGCAGCHSGGSFAYTLDISGAPTTVAPGSFNTSFAVVYTGSGAVRGGFNLAVESLAGTLDTLDAEVQIIGDEATHNGKTTPDGGGDFNWGFRWDAPATVGVYTFFVCANPVNNDLGTTGDGFIDCISENVTVNTSPNAVNDAPTAISEDSVDVCISVLANDTSGASGDESGDSISLFSLGAPSQGGSVAVGGGTCTTSQVRYSPAANFNGSETFTYTIRDSLSSASFQDTATVTMTVNAVNDAPVATDDSVTVDRNSTDNPVPAAGTVLTNDTDVDSTMSVTEVNGSTNATVATTNGSVTRSGNTLTYTPTAGYAGPDSFDYTVSDGTLTDTGTVTVTVVAVAVPDSTSVGEDSADNSIDVLANDTLADAGRTIVSVGAPDQGGTAVIFGTDPNEVIRYTPAPDFFGTETFTYTMTDSSNVQDSALVTVTVTAVNDAPQIVSSAITTAQDAAPYSYQVAVSDVDDANDGSGALTWSLTAAPAGMTVSTTGLIEWTPPIDVANSENVTVQVADGGEDGVAAASQSFTIDVTVPDSDSDGMPDSFENLHGFDPTDATDADEDADGDGASNLEEYQNGTDPTLDDIAPAVTAPADLVVPATGYLTVVDLGTATAIDGRDGAVEVVSDGTFPVVRPGRYTVTWTASDLTGNVGTDTQQVDVLPLADFNVDQVTGEGRTVSVTVTLNGTPPEYPVTIPYTLSGTADSTDTDAVDGTFTINAGLSATLPVVIASNADNAIEFLTFTMTGADQAAPGARATHTIVISDLNEPPSVELVAFQNALPRFVAFKADGPVTVQATAVDPNGTPVVVFNWTGSDDALGVDAMTGSSVSFDPSVLATGAYHVSVSTPHPTGVVIAFVLISVVEGSSAEVDIDGDAILDSVDSVVDYGALLPDQAGDLTSSRLLEADAGLRMRRGGDSIRANRTGALISMDDLVARYGEFLSSATPTRDSHDHTGGIFDFEIHGLAPSLFNNVGATARIVLPLQVGARPGAVYRKFDPNTGWRDFVVDESNAVASAYSDFGQCPGPDSDEYVAGLQPFADCVRLTIQDGGPNDTDGLNGVIRDPGGVAIPEAVEEPAPSVSSGAWLALWLPLAALLRLRRRAAIALLALAATLAALPAQAEHHVRIHYSGDVATGFDDNVTNAQNDADIRESGFTSAGANMDYQRALSLYTTLLLRGSGQYEYWNSFDGLNNAKATAMARVLYRGDGDFYTPTLAAWLSVAALEFDSEIRDGAEYRAGAFVTENLTTQVTGRFALTASHREAAGRVFDLEGLSASLNLDWVPAPRMTVYTGYQFYDGGVASTATPSLWIGVAAEAIEADDAFGGIAGGLRAYRLDAQASIVTLGFNYAFTRKLSADLQGQYISTRADARNEYERTVGVVSLLARF